MRPPCYWLLLPFILAGLAMSCSSDDDGDDRPVNTPAAAATSARDGATPSAAATTRPSGAAAAGDDLGSLVDGLGRVRSYRARVTLESGATGKLEGTLEAVVPDRFHFTLTGGALGSFELISIGNDTYLRFAGSWTKQSGLASAFDVRGVTGSLESLRSSRLNRGGTATVNGKRCQIYASADGALETCVADSLPQRIVMKASGTTITLVFTEFNANIDIKAPI